MSGASATSPVLALPLTAPDRVWQRALAALEADPAISRASFSTWLRGTQLISMQGPLAVVGAQHAFARDKLERSYRTAVEDAIRHAAGRADVQVRFVVAREPFRSARLPSEGPPAAGSGSALPSPARPLRAGQVPAVQAPTPDTTPEGVNGTAPLQPHLTFSSFISGRSTDLAYAAGRAVAANPARSYNPLFLHGPSGVGKTHLLHAIGNRTLAARPEEWVLYTLGDAYVEAVEHAAAAETLATLRRRYAAARVLLFDDVHAIAGSPAAQRELLLLLSTLTGRQIVLAASAAPRTLPVDERLRTRLMMGLVAELGYPDVETRLALLRRKAEALRPSIPVSALELIARRVPGSAPELAGALTSVLAAAQLARLPVTVELAARVLDGAGSTTGRARVLPKDVLAAVADGFGVSEQELAGKRREKEIVLPRQVAMYLMREETTTSFAEIGVHLGGRDHTTVLHGYERMAGRMASDGRLREQVEAIRQRLAAVWR